METPDKFYFLLCDIPVVGNKDMPGLLLELPCFLCATQASRKLVGSPQEQLSGVDPTLFWCFQVATVQAQDRGFDFENT